MKGYGWNHKRVYRIYRELDLNLRIKPRRRIRRDYPGELDVPKAPNQVWSMDFMPDGLRDGRTIRTFNVIDDYNREGLGKAARSMLGWSATELAERSGVGAATLKRYERSPGVPTATVRVLMAIKATLEAAGIEFTGNPEVNPGVVLHLKPSE